MSPLDEELPNYNYICMDIILVIIPECAKCNSRTGTQREKGVHEIQKCKPITVCTSVKGIERVH